MKTIYLSRQFVPVTIPTHAPGDIYSHPVLGDCRRLTAKRLCLMGERADKESDALLRLLEAVGEAAEDGEYDGRAVDGWYGLVGLVAPKTTEGDLHFAKCSRCGADHWYGIPELRTLCFDCWAGALYVPETFVS